MAEITIFDPGNSSPDPEQEHAARSRILRGVLATARATVVVGKILGMAAFGVGCAIGGYAMVASSSDTLTSSDKVLLQLISAPPSADARNPRGQIAAERDPFATRRAAPEEPPTPEQSLCWKRSEALVTFGFGLFIAALSLVGFGLAWDETAEAFDALRRRSDRQ